MIHRVIFFGTEQFAVQILQSLLDDTNHYTVVAVVTQPPRPVGRKQIITESPVSRIASRCGIKIFTPETLKVDSVVKELMECNADVFVVAQYGRIIPQKVLNIPSKGAVNVHTSMLPYYRGATPVHSAIYAGEKETGVSFMKMDAQMDHGDVFSQYPLTIYPTDTTETLFERLAECSGKHFPSDLDKFLTGKIEAQTQDHSSATFTKILSREDGFIDWSTMDAAQIERMTRAFFPWPGVTTKINNLLIKIIAAHIFDTNHVGTPGLLHVTEKTVQIETILGTLEISSLQPAGKQVMSAEQFINGHRALDGSVCTNIITSISV